MIAIMWSILVLLLIVPVWTRNGVTIDKLECFNNPSMCANPQCDLTIADNNPFVSSFSFACNLTKSCATVFVRVKSFVKIKKVDNLKLEVKLDTCALIAGAKNPLIQTFMGPEIFEKLEEQLMPCPWGPGWFDVTNFTIDCTKFGFFGAKRSGQFRIELEFTCGQKSQVVTLKFYGRRNVTIVD